MMKKTILGIALLSLGVSSLLAAGRGGDAKDRFDRVDRIYNELPAEVQEQVDALKEARQSLRETLKTDYLGALGADATAAERAAAIAQYKEDYADEIAANRELAKETFESVKENLPDRPEVSEEVQALIDEQKAARAELKTALKARLATLPEGATRAEVKAAVQAFNAENAEAIAANKALRQEIRAMVKEANKADDSVALTAEVVDREELSPELAKARNAFQNQRRELLANAKSERAMLRDLSADERAEALVQLRSELRDDLRDLKEARREFIKDQIGQELGDRRPDE